MYATVLQLIFTRRNHQCTPPCGTYIHWSCIPSLGVLYLPVMASAKTTDIKQRYNYQEPTSRYEVGPGALLVLIALSKPTGVYINWLLHHYTLVVHSLVMCMGSYVALYTLKMEGNVLISGVPILIDGSISQNGEWYVTTQAFP